MMGQSVQVKVICRKVSKHTRKNQDRNPEMITILKTVSAASRLLPPIVVNKGQAHLEGWHVFVKSEGPHFGISGKGWTSRIIGLDYLIKIFEPNSKFTYVPYAYLLVTLVFEFTLT